MDQFGWTNHGTYLSNGKLSKKVYHQAQPRLKFRQFCGLKESFGKGAGETVNYNKTYNVSTEGGTLVETSTMRRSKLVMTQGTLTVTEYGNSLEWTGKQMYLSEINTKPEFRQALENDQVKVIDKAVEAQMDECSYRYVAGTADGVIGTLTTNGTAGGTASSNMGKLHLENMVDQLLILDAPPAASGFYTCIHTVRTHRGVHDSLEAVWKYTKYPLNGEVGKYYLCRNILETNAMDKNIGADNVTGEAYMFGDQAVMEAVALMEEVRAQSSDYGRAHGLAWYAIMGFDLMWRGDPDYRVIKFDSL